MPRNVSSKVLPVICNIESEKELDAGSVRLAPLPSTDRSCDDGGLVVRIRPLAQSASPSLLSDMFIPPSTESPKVIPNSTSPPCTAAVQVTGNSLSKEPSKEQRTGHPSLLSDMFVPPAAESRDVIPKRAPDPSNMAMQTLSSPVAKGSSKEKLTEAPNDDPEEPSISNPLVTPQRAVAAKPLKSALRSSSKALSKKCTRPRVRGLWKDDQASSVFALIHDEMLVFIMSFLSMAEVCKAIKVSKRFQHVGNKADVWRHVDASEFVQTAYYNFREDTNLTSRSLAWQLERHTPVSLTIRNIQSCLSADVFLPSLKNLQELTLTGFSDLTDTHVHVMLLSSCMERGHRSSVLRKLVLENCPLLTNSTVRSIAKLCTALEELSLCGNRGIDTLDKLQDQFSVLPCTQSLPPSGAFSQLFAPAPPVRRNNSLESLFAPPSPTGRSSLRSSFVSGNLCRIHLSDSGVSPESLVCALKSDNNIVELESLHFSGSGEAWTDALLMDFSQVVEHKKLQELDIGCADPIRGASQVTDKGFCAFSDLPALQYLNIAGHKGISCKGLSKLLLSAPQLCELNLNGCKGMVSRSLATVFADMGALSTAFSKLKDLKTLSLAFCFSEKQQAQAKPDLLYTDETFGKSLLGALRSNKKLQKLNLTDCWFVTERDLLKLREASPILSVNYTGTRAERKLF